VGEAARVVDAADFLIQRGHRAEIICRDGYSVAEAASRRRLPHTKVHMQSRFNGVYDIADLLKIRSRIREFQPHVVHAHRGKDHWLAAAALWTLGAKVPLIRTRHVVTPIKDHRANRWLFGKATQGLICVSTAVREEVARSESLIHCPIKTITGGVNPNTLGPVPDSESAAFRRRYHIPEGAPVITCLARLAPVKGQEHILRAIPAVLKEHPDAVFVFSFPRKSEYAERLSQIAKELDVTAAVRWIGDLDSLGPLFGATDIGLLASIGSEGWSRATAEFLYHRIPVIASEVGCLAELIHDGQNGYLIEKRDSETMANRIGSLLNHPERIKAMGAEGETLVKSRFTFNHTVDGLEETYREIISNYELKPA
jgi:glycosyltransferase involved in cell wall biosynthesis